MDKDYTIPAHPTMFTDESTTENGMTLLDRFACQYIPHDIQKPKSLLHWFKWAIGKTYQTSTADYKDIARHAYAQATAMIEERKKYVN